MNNVQKYLQTCKTNFWKKVFNAELAYILRELNEVKKVLSVGCGPAIIEAGLAEHGFNVTGLDISEEALGCAPDTVRTVADSAEKMTFADNSFDAVIYIASLQFIGNYKQAIKQTVRVLKPRGKIIAMLLNPQSQFFKEKTDNPTSYVNKIKHTDLREIEKTIAEYFSIQTEYFLGINNKQIFKSQSPYLAGLYVIKGKKKDSVQ